jgi:hypothetical protein
MKLLVVFALCCISLTAFSQVPNHKDQRNGQLQDTVYNFKGDNGEMLRKQFRDYFEKRKFQNQLLGNKQGNIVLLPPDHMPCVVPDSTLGAFIPNAWPDVKVPFKPQYHSIPNPALPGQTYSDKQDELGKGGSK